MKRVMVVLFAGLLVVGACSSDDGDDSSSTTVESTTTEEVEALALDEWIEEADAICQDANDANDELPEIETIDDLVDQAPDALAIFEDQYDELVALGLPDEMADEVEEALALLEEQIGIVEEIVDAGDDEDAITTLLDEGQEIGEQADELAAEIGLEVCGSDSDQSDDTDTTESDDTTDTTVAVDGEVSDLLATALGDLGLTSEESSCVSNGMLAKYSVTEMAELDSQDPAVQAVIIEILFDCVTPERIVELGLQ